MWLVIACVVGVVTLLSYYRIQQRRLIETAALNQAEQLTQTLALFRTVYTREVVSTAVGLSIPVTHDYDQGDLKGKALPLPATLSMKLGNELTESQEGGQTKLYSAYPFPYPGREGLKDQFARDAWEALNEQPNNPFYSFEDAAGQPMLRYAIADVMRESCVGCHNSHQDSPKRDWKENDVRGVLEVTLPLDRGTAVASTHLRGMSLTLILGTVGMLGLIAFILNRLRKIPEELEVAVQERTKEVASSQQELRRSESAIRAIVDTAVDSIITIDARGTIQSANSATERLFGYEQKELIGKNVNCLMPPPYAEEHDGYLQAYLETGVPKILGIGGRELSGKHRDGKTFPIDLAVSEVKTDGERRFTGIVRDITERKQAESELRQAKEEAEAANITKSQFLANMSHELRTPMNAIIGYSEMLEEEAEDLGQKDFIPDLRKIHSAGKHLLDLINSILDLSKIEAGRMDVYVEEFDLEPLLQEVATTIRPLVERRANSLEVHYDERVGTMRSDQTKVRQCLFNLLSNASKFTENGLIQLQVTRETKDGLGWIIICVKDEGIGMSPEQVEKVFDAFTQAEGSTTRKYGGTGLGLTITKEFCQMLGGDLSVTSELGKGTIFTIRVPADIEVGTDYRPPLEPTAPAESRIGTSLQPTILLVDDDPTIHDLLGRFLSKEGFQVVSAYQGEDAIRIAKEIHPTAITLDIMMPGMDGWAVLKRLKGDPETADIPVIMASMLQNEDLGYAVGASEVLSKPVDRKQLVAILDNYRVNNPASTILVVEDDHDTRQMVVKSLKKIGCGIAEAENGRIALECVHKQRPDLILLDLMMPEMDGFEFVKELRREESQRSIPIIVLTAKDLTAEDQDRLRGEVQSVRQKGVFTREELLDEVLNFLRYSSGDAAERT